MTPLTALIAGLAAGWLVRGPRRAAAAAIVPYLIVLAMQTYSLAAGYGVSPPSTVDALPGAIGYYVFQAVFLALGAGIAAELAALRRARRPAHPGAGAGRRMVLVSALLAGLAIVFDAGWALTSAPVAHHSAQGGPPPQGLAGIGLCIVTFAALSVLTIRNRRSARAKPAGAGAAAAMAGDRR